MEQTLETKNLFGIDITNETQDKILEYVMDLLMKSERTCTIFTPNPEIIMYARKHTQFKTILNQAQVNLCDGVGLFMAGKVMGKPIKERIAGVDFMENLCKRVVRKPITVGFLGGGPGVAERTAECLQTRYAGLNVSYIAQEWNLEAQETMKRSVVDILFVAFGFPKQEEWITTHLPKLPIRVAMGVGGSFDVISGTIRRAPFLIRAVGLEWLYRLIRQPWRWRRQLALLSFIRLTLNEVFATRKDTTGNPQKNTL